MCTYRIYPSATERCTRRCQLKQFKGARWSLEEKTKGLVAILPCKSLIVLPFIQCDSLPIRMTSISFCNNYYIMHSTQTVTCIIHKHVATTNISSRNDTYSTRNWRQGLWSYEMWRSLILCITSTLKNKDGNEYINVYITV